MSIYTKLNKLFLFILVLAFSKENIGQSLVGNTTINWSTLSRGIVHDYGDILTINSPLFNNLHCNITLDRLKISDRGATFHTDGSENVSSYPSWVQVRSEVREQPLSSVVYGNTQVYEYIFEIDTLPHLTGPVTIWQRFHKGLDAPDLDIELKGDGQWPSDTALQNGSVLVKAFGQWWKTYLLPKEINHLKVAVYSHQNGQYKVSLNGITIAEDSNLNTTPDTNQYSGPQWGVYNHGGTYDKIQLTHFKYVNTEWDSAINFNTIQTQDFNCGIHPWTTNSLSKTYNQELFETNFDLTLDGKDLDDGVVGLSHKATVTGFDDLAAILQMSPVDTTFKVRNGNTYQADNSLKWEWDSTYTVRFNVDILASTYSVWVKPTNGVEVQIANNYAFRTTWNGNDSLAYLAHWTKDGGCIGLSNIQDSTGSTTGIAGNSNKISLVYPNPTEGWLYTGHWKYDKIGLFTNEGKFIRSYKNQKNINVEHLPNGIYHVIFYDNGNVRSKQEFVKK